jgi:hypothetical protein
VPLDGFAFQRASSTAPASLRCRISNLRAVGE